MWMGRLSNKALASVLRSYFTKKLKLGSIRSSYFQPVSCPGLLAVAPSAQSTWNSLKQPLSLIIPALPGSLIIHTTFERQLFVYIPHQGNHAPKSPPGKNQGNSVCLQKCSWGNSLYKNKSFMVVSWRSDNVEEFFFNISNTEQKQKEVNFP